MLPNPDGSHDKEEFDAKYRGSPAYWCDVQPGARHSSSSIVSPNSSLTPTMKKGLSGETTKRQMTDSGIGFSSVPKRTTKKKANMMQRTQSGSEDDFEDDDEKEVSRHLRSEASKLTAFSQLL